MSFAFETKDRAKSTNFIVRYTKAALVELKKGSKIKYLGKEVTIESIREVEIGKNDVIVRGKCR